MKHSITSKLSLRAKFKSLSLIEVVVVNHVTGEEITVLLDYASGTILDATNEEPDLDQVAQNEADAEESAEGEGGSDNGD